MNGWRCPKCGSDALMVQISSWAKLIQTLDRDDGSDHNEFVIDYDVARPEWDSTAPMSCLACPFEGKAQDFVWRRGPKGSISVIAERPEKEAE